MFAYQCVAEETSSAKPMQFGAVKMLIIQKVTEDWAKFGVSVTLKFYYDQPSSNRQGKVYGCVEFAQNMILGK